MDMPDGWEKLSYIKPMEGWRKGGYRVTGVQGMYVWLEYGKNGEHGGFSDPVSCAVACELATGGCTGGHA